MPYNSLLLKILNNPNDSEILKNINELPFDQTIVQNFHMTVEREQHQLQCSRILINNPTISIQKLKESETLLSLKAEKWNSLSKFTQAHVMSSVLLTTPRGLLAKLLLKSINNVTFNEISRVFNNKNKYVVKITESHTTKYLDFTSFLSNVYGTSDITSINFNVPSTFG